MGLPDEVIRELIATPIPVSARVEDRLVWKYSPKGAFDLKSAYLLATESVQDIPFKGSWILEAESPA